MSFKKIIATLIITFSFGCYASVPYIFATQTGNVPASWLDADFAAILNSDQIYSGSAFFANGSPWYDVKAFGAKGDGTTDDSTAIQAAITAAQSSPTGGTVYFPPSTSSYCVKSGISVTGSVAVRLYGASRTIAISACGGNTAPTVSMTAAYSSIENLSVFGKGSNNDSTTFGATYDAVAIGSGCVNCVLLHDSLYGGKNTLSIKSTSDVFVEDVFAQEGYGSAVVYVSNGGNWFIRDKIDQSWPVSQPSFPTTFGSWASTTAYTIGTVVSTQGYLIQCTHGGTSGSSQPTLKNYGLTITDGSNGLTWQLVGAGTYYGIQLDTGASENSFIDMDMSGSYTSGLALTNTLSGAIPKHTKISHSVIGQNYQSGVYAHYGDDLVLDNMEIAGPILSGAASIYLDTTWTGDTTISNSILWGGSYGILVGAGSNINILGNRIFGEATAGILLNGGSNINVTGNAAGTSSVYGTNQTGILTSVGVTKCMVIGNTTYGASTGFTNNASCAISGNN